MHIYVWKTNDQNAKNLYMKKILTLGGLMALLLACQPPGRVIAEKLFLVKPKGKASYDLRNYQQKYFLPYALEEVSGLTYVSDGVLGCVQDEDGKLFLYDYRERKIVHTQKFWKPGDYEGLEVIDTRAYVVSSKGHIYRFNVEGKADTKEINTPLGKKNNIEGLGMDAKTGKLLLVCKGESSYDKKEIKGQAAFVFDPETEKMEEKPFFSITKKQIKNFLEAHKNNAYEENRINFKPSGIALHPIDDHFYILASTGKLLLVVDRSGQLLASYPISSGVLGQPEGICFSPKGDLFIASEGEGDKGYILKFEMKYE